MLIGVLCFYLPVLTLYNYSECLCTMALLLIIHILAAEGQVTETIGFGQFIDSAQEGESQIVRVRLEPTSISENITGRIVPLTVEQFENYTFTTPRTIPDSVQEAIDAITDPAECEYQFYLVSFLYLSDCYLLICVSMKHT